MRRKGANVIEFNTFKPNFMAPTLIVDQVLGFYRIGGLVQVTYGSSITTGRGNTETVQACNLVWQPQQLLKACETFGFAITEWRDGTFREVLPENVGLRRPRTQ